MTNMIDYVKNVAKSVAYSAADELSETAESSKAFITTNKELMSEVYTSMKDLRKLTKRITGYIKKSKVYEAADEGVKAVLEDIKTGKFYNKERIAKFEERALGSTMDFGDEDEFGFTGFEDSTSSNEGIADDGDLSGFDDVEEAVVMSSRDNAAAISTTVAKVGASSIAASKANTLMLYDQQIKANNIMEKGFTSIFDRIGEVNKVNFELASTHADNAAKFFESTTSILQEQNSLLQQIVENQKASMGAVAEEKKSSTRITYRDVIGSNGELNIRSYLKNIKQNIGDAMPSELRMLFGNTIGGENSNLLLTYASSPLRVITDFVAKSLIPGITKKAVQDLDNTISGSFSGLLANFNRMQNSNEDNEFKKWVGKIFGVRNVRTETPDPKDYNKGQMPWNGIAQKSITEVIPGYLRRIEALLSGEGERIYKWSTGKWSTARDFREEYDRSENAEIKSAYRDVQSQMTNLLKKSAFFTDDQWKDLNENMERFLKHIIVTDYGNPRFTKDSAKKYWDYGISNEETMQLLIDAFMNTQRSERAQLSRNAFQAKDRQAERLNSLFKDNMEMIELFNNSRPNYGYTWDKNQNKFTRIPGLVHNNAIDKILDDKGHNIFFYLQKMYQEMAWFREAGYGTGASVSTTTSRANRPVALNVSYNPPPVTPRSRVIYSRDYRAPEPPPLFRDLSSIFPDDNEERKRKEREAEAKEERNKKMADEARDRGIIIFNPYDDSSRTAVSANMKKLHDKYYGDGSIDSFIESDETKSYLAANGTWINADSRDARRRRREIIADIDKRIAEKTKSELKGDSIADNEAEKKYGFFDRIHEAETAAEKFAIFTNSLDNVVNAPSKLLTNIILKADERIYGLVFGDEKPHYINGKPVKSVLEEITFQIKGTFEKLNTWIDNKIIKPFQEKGIHTIGDFFQHIGEMFNLDLKGSWKNIKEGVKKGAKNAVDSVKEAAGAAANFLRGGSDQSSVTTEADKSFDPNTVTMLMVRDLQNVYGKNKAFDKIQELANKMYGAADEVKSFDDKRSDGNYFINDELITQFAKTEEGSKFKNLSTRESIKKNRSVKEFKELNKQLIEYANKKLEKERKGRVFEANDFIENRNLTRGDKLFNALPDLLQKIYSGEIPIEAIKRGIEINDKFTSDNFYNNSPYVQGDRVKSFDDKNPDGNYIINDSLIRGFKHTREGSRFKNLSTRESVKKNRSVQEYRELVEELIKYANREYNPNYLKNPHYGIESLDYKKEQAEKEKQHRRDIISKAKGIIGEAGLIKDPLSLDDILNLVNSPDSNYSLDDLKELLENYLDIIQIEDYNKLSAKYKMQQHGKDFSIENLLSLNENGGFSIDDPVFKSYFSQIVKAVTKSKSIKEEEAKEELIKFILDNDSRRSTRRHPGKASASPTYSIAELKKLGLDLTEGSDGKFSISNSLADILNILNIEDKAINRVAKGARYITKTGLTTIHEGEMVIPSELNPYNPNRGKVSKSTEIANENRVKNKFLSGLSRIIGRHSKGTTSYGMGTAPLSGTAAQSIDFDPENYKKFKTEDGKMVYRFRSKNDENIWIEVTLTEKEMADNNLSMNPNFPDVPPSGVGTQRKIREDGSAVAETAQEKIKKGVGLVLKNSGMEESYNKASDAVKKYGAAGVGGGLLGGGIGLGLSALTGIAGGPIVGAIVGAVGNIARKSETVSNFLFGEVINEEDGTRAGGLISSDVQGAFKKYAPSMTKFGLGGALAGLITPFGPIGGALIGSTIGFMRKNDDFQGLIFGEDGIFSLEDKEKFKKALPTMGLGAGVGALTGLIGGPFGILGGAAVGAAGGFISTTDQFKDLLLGKEYDTGKKDKDGNPIMERTGGVLGAVKKITVDPLKNGADYLKENLKSFIENDIINPLKDGVKPLAHMLKNGIKSLTTIIPNAINKVFESKLGVPIQAWLQDRVLKPATKFMGNIVKLPFKLAGDVISAPFKVFGWMGNNIRANQIKRGTDLGSTAAERLAWRDQHKIRSKKIFGFRTPSNLNGNDGYRTVDENLANMSDTDIEALYKNIVALQSFEEGSDKLLTNTTKEIKDLIATRFETGNMLTGPARVIFRELREATTRGDGNYDRVYKAISNLKSRDGKPLSTEEANALIGNLSEVLHKYDAIKAGKKLTSEEAEETRKKLVELGFVRDKLDLHKDGFLKGLPRIFTHEGTGEFNLDKISGMLSSEKKGREKDGTWMLLENTEKQLDTQSETSKFVKDISDTVSKMLDILSHGNTAALINGDYKDNTEPSTKKERAIRSKLAENEIKNYGGAGVRQEKNTERMKSKVSHLVNKVGYDVDENISESMSENDIIDKFQHQGFYKSELLSMAEEVDLEDGFVRQTLEMMSKLRKNKYKIPKDAVSEICNAPAEKGWNGRGHVRERCIEFINVVHEINVDIVKRLAKISKNHYNNIQQVYAFIQKNNSGSMFITTRRALLDPKSFDIIKNEKSNNLRSVINYISKHKTYADNYTLIDALTGKVPTYTENRQTKIDDANKTIAAATTAENQLRENMSNLVAGETEVVNAAFGRFGGGTETAVVSKGELIVDPDDIKTYAKGKKPKKIKAGQYQRITELSTNDLITKLTRENIASGKYDDVLDGVVAKDELTDSNETKLANEIKRLNAIEMDRVLMAETIDNNGKIATYNADGKKLGKKEHKGIATVLNNYLDINKKLEALGNGESLNKESDEYKEFLKKQTELQNEQNARLKSIATYLGFDVTNDGDVLRKLINKKGEVYVNKHDHFNKKALAEGDNDNENNENLKGIRALMSKVHYGLFEKQLGKEGQYNGVLGVLGNIGQKVLKYGLGSLLIGGVGTALIKKLFGERGEKTLDTLGTTIKDKVFPAIDEFGKKITPAISTFFTDTFPNIMRTGSELLITGAGDVVQFIGNHVDDIAKVGTEILFDAGKIAFKTLPDVLSGVNAGLENITDMTGTGNRKHYALNLLDRSFRRTLRGKPIGGTTWDIPTLPGKVLSWTHNKLGNKLGKVEQFTSSKLGNTKAGKTIGLGGGYHGLSQGKTLSGGTIYDFGTAKEQSAMFDSLYDSLSSNKKIDINSEDFDITDGTKATKILGNMSKKEAKAFTKNVISNANDFSDDYVKSFMKETSSNSVAGLLASKLSIVSRNLKYGRNRQKLASEIGETATEGMIRSFDNTSAVKKSLKQTLKDLPSDACAGLANAARSFNPVTAIFAIEDLMEPLFFPAAAKEMLNITTEPTFWQRLICGVLNMILGLIPYIGAFLPVNKIVYWLFDYNDGLLKDIDLAGISTAMHKSDILTAEFNKVTGLNISNDEFNTYVLGDRTLYGLIGDATGANAKTENEFINKMRGFYADKNLEFSKSDWDAAVSKFKTAKVNDDFVIEYADGTKSNTNTQVDQEKQLDKTNEQLEAQTENTSNSVNILSSIDSKLGSIVDYFNSGETDYSGYAAQNANTVNNEALYNDYLQLANAGLSQNDINSILTQKYGYSYGSGSGRYSQRDKSINMRYNKPGDSIYQDINSSGCGPIAATNLINRHIKAGMGLIEPNEAANYALKHGYKETNGGTDPRYFKNYFKLNGIDADITSNKSAMRKAISNGQQVVLMGKNSRYGSGATPYGPNPHYVVATGVNGSDIIVDNPEEFNEYTAYDANDTIRQSSKAIITNSKFGMGGSNIIHTTDGNKYSQEDANNDNGFLGDKRSKLLSNLESAKSTFSKEDISNRHLNVSDISLMKNMLDPTKSIKDMSLPEFNIDSAFSDFSGISKSFLTNYFKALVFALKTKMFYTNIGENGETINNGKYLYDVVKDIKTNSGKAVDSIFSDLSDVFSNKSLNVKFDSFRNAYNSESNSRKLLVDAFNDVSNYKLSEEGSETYFDKFPRVYIASNTGVIGDQIGNIKSFSAMMFNALSTIARNNMYVKAYERVLNAMKKSGITPLEQFDIEKTINATPRLKTYFDIGRTANGGAFYSLDDPSITPILGHYNKNALFSNTDYDEQNPIDKVFLNPKVVPIFSTLDLGTNGELQLGSDSGPKGMSFDVSKNDNPVNVLGLSDNETGVTDELLKNPYNLQFANALRTTLNNVYGTQFPKYLHPNVLIELYKNIIAERSKGTISTNEKNKDNKIKLFLSKYNRAYNPAKLEDFPSILEYSDNDSSINNNLVYTILKVLKGVDPNINFKSIDESDVYYNKLRSEQDDSSVSPIPGLISAWQKDTSNIEDFIGIYGKDSKANKKVEGILDPSGALATAVKSAIELNPNSSETKELIDTGFLNSLFNLKEYKNALADKKNGHLITSVSKRKETENNIYNNFRGVHIFTRNDVDYLNHLKNELLKSKINNDIFEGKTIKQALDQDSDSSDSNLDKFRHFIDFLDELNNNNGLGDSYFPDLNGFPNLTTSKYELTNADKTKFTLTPIEILSDLDSIIGNTESLYKLSYTQDKSDVASAEKIFKDTSLSPEDKFSNLSDKIERQLMLQILMGGTSEDVPYSSPETNGINDTTVNSAFSRMGPLPYTLFSNLFLSGSSDFGSNMLTPGSIVPGVSKMGPLPLSDLLSNDPFVAINNASEIQKRINNYFTSEYLIKAINNYSDNAVKVYKNLKDHPTKIDEMDEIRENPDLLFDKYLKSYKSIYSDGTDSQIASEVNNLWNFMSENATSQDNVFVPFTKYLGDVKLSTQLEFLTKQSPSSLLELLKKGGGSIDKSKSGCIPNISSDSISDTGKIISATGVTGFSSVAFEDLSRFSKIDADEINRHIENVYKIRGVKRYKPFARKGSLFVQLANTYKVNPRFVLAVIQIECGFCGDSDVPPTKDNKNSYYHDKYRNYQSLMDGGYSENSYKTMHDFTKSSYNIKGVELEKCTGDKAFETAIKNVFRFFSEVSFRQRNQKTAFSLNFKEGYVYCGTSIWLTTVCQIMESFSKNTDVHYIYPTSQELKYFKSVEGKDFDESTLPEEPSALSKLKSGLLKIIEGIWGSKILELVGLKENKSRRMSNYVGGFSDARDFFAEGGLTDEAKNPSFTQVTSNFGPRELTIDGEPLNQHMGIDMTSSAGEKTNIYSPISGTVAMSGNTGDGYGNKAVILDNGDELGLGAHYHLFGHMSKNNLKIGDKINAGDFIGKMGTTGKSSGVHLHYGVAVPKTNGSLDIGNRYYESEMPASGVPNDGMDWSDVPSEFISSDHGWIDPDSYINNYMDNMSSDIDISSGEGSGKSLAIKAASNQKPNKNYQPAMGMGNSGKKSATEALLTEGLKKIEKNKVSSNYQPAMGMGGSDKPLHFDTKAKNIVRNRLNEGKGGTSDNNTSELQTLKEISSILTSINENTAKSNLFLAAFLKAVQNGEISANSPMFTNIINALSGSKNNGTLDDATSTLINTMTNIARQ